MSIAEKFETIADAVYQKGYEDGAGNNTGDSYDEGYTDGYNTGFEHGEAEGYGKGKNDEYNAFWDAYQNNGEIVLTGYTYAFYGPQWTDEIYNPLYDIKVGSTCNGIFLNSRITNTKVTIDISNSNIKNNTVNMFENATNLKEIPLLKLKNDGSNNLNNNFSGCKALTTINFEGKIGRNATFVACPLSVVSMKNIIAHLKDYSEDADSSGKYTLTFSDDCWERLEASGASPDGDTWRNYIIKLGWLVG